RDYWWRSAWTYVNPKCQDNGLSSWHLEPTPNSPAGQVADFQITAPYNDQAALTKLAKESDVLTYEFE
ncbi:phosphoribosylaminoimidazole carboxylase ATPase subunit, partial [Lacticaseibacillus rhamnosus MTCC 5462]